MHYVMFGFVALIIFNKKDDLVRVSRLTETTETDRNGPKRTGTDRNELSGYRNGL